MISSISVNSTLRIAHGAHTLDYVGNLGKGSLLSILLLHIGNDSSLVYDGRLGCVERVSAGLVTRLNR